MSDNGWQRLLERSRWEKQLLEHWRFDPVVVAGMEWHHGTQRYFPGICGGTVMAWYLEIGGYRGQAGDLNFRLKRFLVNVQTGRESLFHGLLSPKACDEFMRREVEPADG